MRQIDIHQPRILGSRNNKSSRSRSRDPNYFPESLGKSFQVELVDLLDRLADAGGFKESYQRSVFLSKYCDSGTTSPEIRRTAAIAKWHKAEKRNKITNQRLLLDEVDFGWCHSSDIIAKAKSIISDVLGPISDASELFCSGHTNGASPRILRSPSAAIEKHSGKAQGTTPALLQWSLGSYGTVLRDQPLEEIQGSVLFTVPKDSDIDRVACKEPEINLFLQRGVGNHIRKRLKRFGVDLNDQRVNQELARTAVSRGLATIDLSSASDSISRQLVFDLLPFEWWSYLDDIRVPFTLVDGTWVELEMFSSMGNGFTFELESLIFWALTRSVCWLSRVRGKINVYGDDIVAPSRIVPRLRRIFSWFGFTINPKKTHWRGDFRESCGKHYYRSLDVSPFYLRGPVQKKTDVIRLLNRLLEWDGRGWGFCTSQEVLEFHARWSSHIPKNLWGGTDPEDPTSLVTGHSPRSRLILCSKELRPILPLEQPALTCWLTLKQVQSSALTLTVPSKGRFKVDKQPYWATRTTWRPWLLAVDDSLCGVSN